MRTALTLLALLGPYAVAAAKSWTFDDGQITVSEKGAGVGAGTSESLPANKPLTSPISLSPTGSLKVSLTALEGSSSRKPHQAFLQLKDLETGLQDAYAFVLKENGKGKVEITQKDILQQLLAANQPIHASIIIASFGSSAGYSQHAFDLTIGHDTTVPQPSVTPPERYGKKAEIHHIFRNDPKSPPRIISLVFTLAVLGALPVLVGTWALLGANLEHASTAMKAQPTAHALFFGSVLAMEGVFVLYYISWNLFQTLPAAAVVGVVAYVSGSRALTEVQERRLAGQR